MNRYESAYRDYTYPQRPERSRARPGEAQRRDSSSSSTGGAGSNIQTPRGRSNHIQGNSPREYVPDEESYHRSDRRSNSDRSHSEYIVANAAVNGVRQYQRSPSLGSGGISDAEYIQGSSVGVARNGRYYESEPRPEDVPEIYIPQRDFNNRQTTSELSHGSYRTYRSAPYSEVATVRSKTSKRGGIVIETSRAPHPLCPNTRGCCCLLLLFNLGLLLICLGFVIVLQLNDPPFVWYLGVFMLVFGFVTILVGLVFCAWMCREGSPDAPLPPHSELYWTHHWRKTIPLPEVHGKEREYQVKEPIEEIRFPDENESYREQRYHDNGRY